MDCLTTLHCTLPAREGVKNVSSWCNYSYQSETPTGTMYALPHQVPPPPPPPPHSVLYIQPKVGVGVFSNMQIVSTIYSPSKGFFVLRTQTTTLPRFMFTVTKVQMIASTVRGHHAWSLNIGEKSCHLNATGHIIHDDFTVAIPNNRNTVGHVPGDNSWYFLRKGGSEITCIVNVNGDY